MFDQFVTSIISSTYFLSLQETEECPLCLEEMDVSDLNFKPCPCGYQVIRVLFLFL
jgi:CCR4-NOT transcription complex subunit 4